MHKDFSQAFESAMNSDSESGASGSSEQGERDRSTSNGGSDNLLTEFARSFAYTAAQRPVTGLCEIYDYFRDTNTAKKFKFMDEPEAADPFSARWHAQALGSATGLLVPLIAAHRMAGGGNAGRIAAGAHTAEAAAMARVSTGTALRRSAVTGLVLEGVLAPAGSEKDGFWGRRLEHGLIGAVNFGGMTGASISLRYAASLRGLGFIAPIARSHIGSNVAGGVLVSPLSTELMALQKGRHATAADLGQSAYANVLGGVAIGAFARLSEHRTAKAAGEAAADSQGKAQPSSASAFGKTRAYADSAWHSARQGASKFGSRVDEMIRQVNPFRPYSDPITPALAMASDTGSGGGLRASMAHEFSKYVKPASDAGRVAPERVGVERAGRGGNRGDSRVASQVAEGEGKVQARTHSIDSLLKGDYALEGHREAFARLKEEFPYDFRGLKSAGAEPIAHGGDSLVIDLAPGQFRDANGNVYHRAVMKIMEAPENPVPGRAWQTPEWKGEWGQRRDDLPLLRQANSEATVEPKEILIAGKRYYIFMQPKGEAYGGGNGKFADAAAEAGQARLEMEDGYHKLLNNMKEDGLVFLDEGSQQIVSWEMMEVNPADPTGPLIKVKHFGIADYPSVGRKGEGDFVPGEGKRVPRREDSDYAENDGQDPYGDRADESLSEAEQLDRAGLHETKIEAPPSGDPVWREMVEMIREYKESRISERDIAETIRLLHGDYLQQHKITAEEAIRQARKSR